MNKKIQAFIITLIPSFIWYETSGLGNPDHLVDVINYGNADAVAIATALHYQKFSLREFREKCLKEHISVRVPPN